MFPAPSLWHLLELQSFTFTFYLVFLQSFRQLDAWICSSGVESWLKTSIGLPCKSGLWRLKSSRNDIRSDHGLGSTWEAFQHLQDWEEEGWAIWRERKGLAADESRKQGLRTDHCTGQLAVTWKTWFQRNVLSGSKIPLWSLHSGLLHIYHNCN